uniref:ABC transporter domain-containing protein n=1 Tax=Macrostomum lignano TaxID=282301 RepID=A0A1I8FXA4_9PLAT
MPSDHKKKRAQAKKDAAKRKDAKKPLQQQQRDNEDEAGSAAGDEVPETGPNGTETVGASSANGAAAASASADKDEDFMGSDDDMPSALASEIETLNLLSDRVVAHRACTSHHLPRPGAAADTKLELNCGRRYGLIGLNGCGKSTLLAALANRELQIQPHVDIFLLPRDAAAEAATRAAELLHGLTAEMQNKQVKHFSGGWRMRISLARALFVKPDLLMLDEPTNHLDLNACRLIYYGGNFDQYMQTRMEMEENQMKRFKWEQGQISNMRNYIARFGHGSAKLARQAQSKEKTLAKMVDKGLTDRVAHDKTVTFYFPDCGEIPPPVIMIQNVSFQYAPGKPFIYKDLDFGVDLDTRVALVGPNGAGKSTLLKLIAGELQPTDGLIRRHSHVRIGRYHQHLHEMLDISLTSLDWMMRQFPEITERDEMRKILGRYGLTGAQQVCPIRTLSDGQRCRIIFAWLANKSPHMLLLDEPTNHLDIETIDALAEAICEFQGGLLLVSHDFRLIQQVAEEIWECNNCKVTKWEGDIFSYKEELTKEITKANDARMK